MIIGGEPKPPLGELAHNGVKGMKWGHHSAKTKTAPKPKKTDSLTDAQRKQRKYAVASIFLSVGAIAVTSVLNKSGAMSMSGIMAQTPAQAGPTGWGQYMSSRVG